MKDIFILGIFFIKNQYEELYFLCVKESIRTCTILYNLFIFRWLLFKYKPAYHIVLSYILKY